MSCQNSLITELKITVVEHHINFSDAWRVGFQMALLHKTCHDKVQNEEVIVSKSIFTQLCSTIFKDDDFYTHNRFLNRE